jgi:hypothetical protein
LSFKTTTIVLLLFCSTLLAQNADYGLLAFHIQGNIRSYADTPISSAEVTFKGDVITMIVSSDENGFYTAKLPVGLYTMTVKPVQRSLQRYRRPLFRATSPTSLTFNITLDPAGPFCDIKKPVPGQPPPADDDVRICGGADSFQVPSQDEVPFDLYIQYETRRPTERGYTYNTGDHLPGSQSAVFVAYNLFTLQADHVVYDVRDRTLEATGNVIVESSDGTVQHDDSLIFKIENGEATPLH